MLTKIFFLESGKWSEGNRDFIKVFSDEQKAWVYGLKRFGTKNVRRDNPMKVKNFRARWVGNSRWVVLTEHKVM